MNKEEKQKINDLIIEIEKPFIKNLEGKNLIWTNIKQDKLNEKITIIADITKIFFEQSEREKNNIKSDLTIIDTPTGKEIPLVDISSMNKRVKNILANNDIFSLCRSLALINKCIHSQYFDGEIKSISTKIDNWSNEVNQQNSVDNFNIDISDLSNNEIEEILETLSKNNLPQKKKNSIMISIMKSLNIDINMKSIEKDYLKIKNARPQLLEAYIAKLQNDKETLMSFQEDLYWIKDQLIVMIAQLLKNDSRYNQLEYELVKNGSGDFENMLAIDYPELSYYIEVHMPNFISHELVKTYGFDEPKDNNNRKFDKLGASSVYDRDEHEIEEIRSHIYDNIDPNDPEYSKKITRRKIISRGSNPIIKGVKKDTQYAFITTRIINNKEASLLEKYLISDNDYPKERISNILKYSKMRSNQNTKNIEYEIQKNVVNTILNKKEDLYKIDKELANNYINKIKTYINKEISNEKRFDKVLYMLAYNKEEDEFLKIMSRQKELSDKYYNEFDNDDNILNIIKYIEKEDIKVFAGNNIKAEYLEEYYNNKEIIDNKNNNIKKEKEGKDDIER